MPEPINPHELVALAAVLAADAGEDPQAVLSMDADELAALFAEGGEGTAPATFPGE